MLLGTKTLIPGIFPAALPTPGHCFLAPKGSEDVAGVAEEAKNKALWVDVKKMLRGEPAARGSAGESTGQGPLGMVS